MCRQYALRTFAAAYIGVNALYLYPRYAKEAFSSAWPWLLRYSNAWVLLMTAVGLMVSACLLPSFPAAVGIFQLLLASSEACQVVVSLNLLLSYAAVPSHGKFWLW